MKNFISEFYSGNVKPQPGHFQRGQEFQKALTTMKESEEQLTKRLDCESKALFLAYVNASDELIGEASVDTFTDGFRLGAAFAIDTFCGENGLCYS